MALIFKNLSYDLISILIALLCCISMYLIQKLTYWKRRNVQTAPGGFNPFAGKSYGETFKIIYEDLKRKKERYGGMFMLLRPAFVLADIKLIQDVMQKDFNSFSNRGYYINEKDDVLSGSLFNLDMAKWKHIRTKLTPTFTSGKLKMMFHTISTCSGELTGLIDESSRSGTPLEAKDAMSRFSTDVIGSCAFGIDCNSMKNPKTKFREYGDKVFEFTLTSLLQFILPHSILRFFKVKLFPQEIEDFFADTVKKTMEFREINNVQRKDFLQLLIEMRNKGYVRETGTNTSEPDEAKRELTMNEMTAQCFGFFAAGFETSATTTTFTLLELAINQDIQDKLREEILGVLKSHNEEITYEAVTEMTYMDKVIYEALRKYPPVPVLDRECTEDYKIPGTSLTIEKGILVRIPIMGIQNDPEFYPDPDKFDPERFNEENKRNRKPFTWLPFGDGPRICIGLKFGVLQVKVALVAILKEYRVTLNEKTIYPVQYLPKSFTLSAEGGIWLNASKI